MTGRISESIALVTGAASGIGRATALLFAREGATVVATDVSTGAGAALLAELGSEGGHLFLSHDVSDEQRWADIVDQVRSRFGRLDILVNNAVGAFQPKPIDALEPEDYLDEMNVSLFGMHACCKLALPHMREQRWGKIINLGTIATEMPPGGQNKYVTIKSALTGYTRSLAAELAGANIQVNLVVPRMTETTLIASLPPALVDKLAEESPSGRLLQPVEVAKTIVFLASDWAGSISGQRLVLNQGEAPFL